MSDDVWKRAEIESPCIKICVIHPDTRLCTGCHRSIDEIAGWGRKTAEERKAIIEALPERAKTNKPTRGGRAARIKNRLL